MVTITLSSVIPAPSASPDWEGYSVKYKVKGRPDSEYYPLITGRKTLPIVINVPDQVSGTLFEGLIWQDCGDLDSQASARHWVTPCNCLVSGYVDNGDGRCVKTDTTPATVTHSDYCFARSVNTGYGTTGARIYTPDFTSADIIQASGGTSHVDGPILTSSYWRSTSIATGPMNINGVWIDSDCNGNRDAITAGVKATLIAQFINTGAARQIYVGVGGDDEISLKVNGVTLIDTGVNVASLGGDMLQRFRIWHLVPVWLVTGANYFNMVAMSTGLVQDAMAMVVYDNTTAQIKAITDGSTIVNVVSRSEDLIGTHFNVATCPEGYSLTESGGVSTCVKTVYMDCNTT